MATSDKFNYLIETKNAIKNAIVEKGQEVSDADTFRSYADKISAITTGNGGEYNVKSVIKNGTQRLEITKATGGEINPVSGKEFTVKAIDYDGTVLKEEKLKQGDVFELPTPPSSNPRLVFQEWSSPVDIIDNTVIAEDQDITIGAVYTTASGLNEFDIEVTKASGFTINLKLNGTKDWGDGTSDTSTSHTYSNYGKYTIKCDGTIASTSSSAGIFGQGENDYHKSPCTSAYISSIENLGYNCFRACANLKTITFSNKVKTLGEYCFVRCASLKTLILPKSITSIGPSSYGAFQRCYALKDVVINNGLEILTKNSFSRCSKLETIAIPKTIKTIGGSCFNDCVSLAKITIPDGVTIIAESTFSNCCSLSSIKLPLYLEKITNTAFIGCSSLEKIEFPKTLENFGIRVFADCLNLKQVIFDNDTNISSWGGSVFEGCNNLESINIPLNINDSVSYGSFANCNNLKDITLPNIQTDVGSNMFENCYNLSNIIIPDSVTTIDTKSFYECRNLKELIISESLTRVNSNAFYNCNGVLKYDFSKCNTVPTLESYNIFDGINGLCKIIVPDNLYNDWIVATNWSTYANYIYKVSEV